MNYVLEWYDINCAAIQSFSSYTKHFTFCIEEKMLNAIYYSLLIIKKENRRICKNTEMDILSSKFLQIVPFGNEL